MLKSLDIKSYALLEQVSVQFQSGLIVFTGETGAGKSIFIDALGAILGEKVDQSVVRQGAEKAIVEAVFSTDESYEVQRILKELDLWDESGDLILRREVLKNGRTRSFINDTPVNIATLIEIGNYIVDLHGQHQHQSLLKVTEHLKFLDQFGKLSKLVQEVGALYQTIQSLRQQLKSLRLKESQLLEKKEIYEFQLAEIQQLNPDLNAEATLRKEEKILQNSEKIFQLSNLIYKNLYEDADSVYDRLSQVSTQLDELVQIDESLNNWANECESARISIDEMAKFLQSYISSFEFNPERLEEIRQSLSEYSGLKKKYGGSLENVLQHRDKIQIELDQMSNLDSEISELSQTLEKHEDSFAQKAFTLSGKRQQAAVKLKNLIMENLAELGMQNARLEIQVIQRKDENGMVRHNGTCLKAAKNGIDLVEFFLAANPGSPPKPLVKVASGGEISRVMLALKLAQADADRLPVMIFDEVDSGVSGRIAQAVGRNLKKLSIVHQIICITHLPQIASMGKEHFLVEKVSDNKQTRTSIRQLDHKERVLAVAKLLGGEKISEAHLRSAKELINER